MKSKLISGTMLALFLMGLLTLAFDIQPVKAIAQVDILSHFGYLDWLGDYHVVGEVENTGDIAVNDVYVTITLYNATDEVILTTNEDIILDILLPGRKSPFHYELFDDILAAKVDHHDLAVSFSEYPDGKPIGLEILWNSSYIEHLIGTYIHVNGEIKNIGTKKATFVKVVATFYSDTGNVVDAWYAYSDPLSIEPDQKAPFEIVHDITDTEAYIVSYSLTAESWEYAIVPEFSTWTSMLLILTVLTFAIIICKRRLLKTPIH